MTTRQTPDAVREALREGFKKAIEGKSRWGVSGAFLQGAEAIYKVALAALDSRAGEGKAESYERRQHIETLTYLQTQYLPGGPRDIKGALRAAVKSLAIPAPAVDAVPAGEVERAGQFLLDRLVDHEVRMTSEADAREWHGHVTPAMSRFRAALSHGEGPLTPTLNSPVHSLASGV